MSGEDIERKFASLLEKYATRGLVNPALALEHDISQKIGLGKTREQAVNELFEENTGGLIGKVEEVTVETLQTMINEQKNGLSVLTSEVEKSRNETAGLKRNFKVMLFSFVFVFLVMGGLLGVSFLQTTQKTWHEVQKFSGSDDQTTNVFYIPGENWRISWGIAPDYPEYALFSFFVYPEGETEEFIHICIVRPSDLETGPGEYLEGMVGFEYLTGTGSFYIEVMSTDAWFITVESYH